MKAFVAIILVVVVGLTGCSGKSTSAPSPTNSYAFNGGAIAGFHGNLSKQTTTFRFSLIPVAYAQTTTVSLSGTYTGYSNVLSGGSRGGQGGGNFSVPVAYPIYGVGTFSGVCAGQGGTVLCPSGFASGSMDPGEALASQVSFRTAIAGTLAPALVTGNGTLGPLVVYAYVDNGTFPPGSPPSDLIEVWVIRNGQVLNSGITCSLPVQDNSAISLQLQRCESTSTFAVQDGDGIVATATLNPADTIYALSFFLVKA